MVFRQQPGERRGEEERRPLARAALHPDFAAVLDDEFPYDGQAQADAVARARAVFNAREFLEYAFPVFGPDAAARVGNGDDGMPLTGALSASRRNGDAAAPGRGFDGVGEE